jgi:hypothetical protein
VIKIRSAFTAVKPKQPKMPDGGSIMNQPIVRTQNRLKSFEEFWPFYVREHSQATNRVVHFIGSTLGLVCLIETFVTGSLWLIPLGLFIGYGFAWFGHFFIERNKPASFKYPLWSFRADWKMWSLMLFGRMESEVRRALALKRIY